MKRLNYQKQIKAKRVEKKELTGSLVDVMKTNEIDCFDINNGALVYTKQSEVMFK